MSNKWVWPKPNQPAGTQTTPGPARPTAAPPLVVKDFETRPPIAGFAETRGQMSYNGGSLELIQAEDGLPFVDLPKKLVELVTHCWKAASANRGDIGVHGQRPGVNKGVEIGGGYRPAAFQAQINQLKNSFNPRDIFEAKKMQERAQVNNAPYVKQVNPLGVKDHLKPLVPDAPYIGAVVPTDWKTHEELKRVNGYTFRGDTRDPLTIEKANGFQPPITRTDQQYVDNVIFPMFQSYMKRRFQMDVSKDQFERVYKEKVQPNEKMVLHNFFVWRSMVENEAYHLGKMLADETLKGYISTSRAVTVAKGFAGEKGGYVYLTLINGGFLVPDKEKHQWTKVFGEQEVALPASVPWSKIFAFRKVGSDGMFTGPVYFRKGFQQRNTNAYREAYELLSGKVQ